MRGWGLEMARFVHHLWAHASGATPEEISMTTQHTTLGDLIEAFFTELVNEYGDEELAEVIASTLINEMILAGHHVDQEIAAA